MTHTRHTSTDTHTTRTETPVTDMQQTMTRYAPSDITPGKRYAFYSKTGTFMGGMDVVRVDGDDAITLWHERWGSCEQRWDIATQVKSLFEHIIAVNKERAEHDLAPIVSGSEKNWG